MNADYSILIYFPALHLKIQCNMKLFIQQKTAKEEKWSLLLLFLLLLLFHLMQLQNFLMERSLRTKSKMTLDPFPYTCCVHSTTATTTTTATT